MAGEWSAATVAECAANEPYSTQIGPFGEKIRAEMYTAAGAPILRGTNVNTEERFHDDDFVFMDSEVAEREFSKFVCEADDVILCHKGTLGKIGIVPKRSRFKRYIMGNSMMKVRCDRRKLEPSFLYYWLTSRDGQDYLFSRVSQVGVPQIQRPLTTLREATIPLPPLPEQRAIARILGTLDDKIELNRRMSETLEAMARALFKSWFVDFDPVRAKAEGRDPGLPKALGDLFPPRLVDSEIGEIPEGWRASKLGHEVVTVLGGTPSRAEPAYWDGGVPWINSGKANEFRVITPSEFITEEGLASSATKLLPTRTTVIAITGATLGQISLTEIETCANQSIVGVLGKTALPSEFIYFWTKEHVEDLLAWQTGGAQQHINKGNVNDLPVLCPNEPAIAAYIGVARPAFDRIKACCNESLALGALRDTLLPKLISGVLRLRDAEKLIERVA